MNNKKEALTKGSSEWRKCNDELYELKQKWREEDHERSKEDAYMSERKKLVDNALSKYQIEKEKQMATLMKPLKFIAIFVAGILLTIFIINKIQDNKRKADPLDLMGYPLSYVCAQYNWGIQNGNSKVQAKTYSDAINGKGDSVSEDGVRVTDYPIDCADFKYGSKEKIWGYYVISYHWGDAGRYVFTSLIVGTKQEALSEGVTIREGY